MQKEWLEIIFVLIVLYGQRGLDKNLVSVHVVTVCTIIGSLEYLKSVLWMIYIFWYLVLTVNTENNWYFQFYLIVLQ